ncbi:MAG: recombination protein RecR [Verrucomicrobia bacterium]|nr:recombination protein RecR [Verrucomicrobiota bacterium]
MRKIEYPEALRALIAQLRQMPGVGPRSAERIALWMVQARHDQPEQIAQNISATRRQVRPCNLCGFFATEALCEICRDETRARDLLCVVEQPTDILPLEKTSAFRGRYHALGGRISPLDHIAPEDLRIRELLQRVEAEQLSEIIFALAADVEGEATTNYLVDLLKAKPLKLTRIARGLPAGGGLESADELTLYQALTGRTQL